MYGIFLLTCFMSKFTAKNIFIVSEKTSNKILNKPKIKRSTGFNFTTICKKTN